MTKDRSLTTAIHILCSLAVLDQRRLTSNDLALTLKTNSGLIRRVLSKLSSHGFISTIKGKNGGSMLSMPADKINLKMIYQAVNSGPLFNTFSKAPFQPCRVSCQIGGIMENVYGELEEHLLNDMARQTLAQIVGKIE